MTYYECLFTYIYRQHWLTIYSYGIFGCVDGLTVHVTRVINECPSFAAYLACFAGTRYSAIAVSHSPINTSLLPHVTAIVLSKFYLTGAENGISVLFIIYYNEDGNKAY
jgi:hypothetical protein